MTIFALNLAEDDSIYIYIFYYSISVYHDIVYSDLWKNDAAETEVTFLDC